MPYNAAWNSRELIYSLPLHAEAEANNRSVRAKVRDQWRKSRSKAVSPTGERIRFISHEGKRILFVDFSKCAAQEVEKISRIVPDYVTKQARGSVLILTSFTLLSDAAEMFWRPRYLQAERHLPNDVPMPRPDNLDRVNSARKLLSDLIPAVTPRMKLRRFRPH